MTKATWISSASVSPSISGFPVIMPGAGALVIRPFYQRANLSSDFVDVDLNTWGVAIGASLLF